MNQKKKTSPSPARKIINKTTKINKSNNFDKILNQQPINDMYITCYIKNKCYKIYCGDGKKPFRWLLDVVLHKYDRKFAIGAGVPAAIKLPNNSILQDFSAQVSNTLNEINNLIIFMKDDYEDYIEESKKNRNNKPTIRSVSPAKK